MLFTAPPQFLSTDWLELIIAATIHHEHETLTDLQSSNRLEEFSPDHRPAPQHLMIYTWPNCTLRELSTLLVSAIPSTLPSPAVGTRLAFRLVYPDAREANRSGASRYLQKDLGSVVIGASGERDDVNGVDALDDLSGEPDKKLQDARFIIGDYITCAVLPPGSDGKVAPPPPPSAGMSRSFGPGPPPRENGYGSGYGGRSRGGPREYGIGGGVPSGPWQRGDIPGAPRTGVGYSRGRGRGRGGW
jgi:histone deacetylase complex subunit SAP18